MKLFSRKPKNQQAKGNNKDGDQSSTADRSSNAKVQSVNSSQRQVAEVISERQAQLDSEVKALHQKVAFLEAENKQLEAQKDNLQETLGINKQILNGVLSGVMSNEEDILGQLQEESDVLIGEIQRMQVERDELSSKVLVLEQINCDLSTKQIEIGQQLDKQVHDLQQQVNML